MARHALQNEVLSIMSNLVAYSDLPGALLICRSTLDKMASDPEAGFPVRYRLGKRLYVKESELKAWLRRRLDFDDVA